MNAVEKTQFQNLVAHIVGAINRPSEAVRLFWGNINLQYRATMRKNCYTKKKLVETYLAIKRFRFMTTSHLEAQMDLNHISWHPNSDAELCLNELPFGLLTDFVE